MIYWNKGQRLEKNKIFVKSRWNKRRHTWWKFKNNVRFWYRLLRLLMKSRQVLLARGSNISINFFGRFISLKLFDPGKSNLVCRLFMVWTCQPVISHLTLTSFPWFNNLQKKMKICDKFLHSSPFLNNCYILTIKWNVTLKIFK